MSTFNRAWQFLQVWEGDGVSEHPADPGGITKYGISLRWYRKAVDRIADADTIRNLKEEEVKKLVKLRWWNIRPYALLVDQNVANRTFSFCYNMGPRNGTRILQRAINRSDQLGVVVKVDGLLGNRTVAAANSIFPELLLNNIREEAKQYYARLVVRRPKLVVFHNGWQRRAEA